MKKGALLHRVTARMKNNSFFSSLLSWSGKEITGKKWVFIIGCYNSGTTLLEDILSNHPKISGLPDEGVMLTDQLIRPEDLKWRRMWCECEMEMEDSPARTEIKSSLIKKHWSHFFNLEKPVFVEKSISNTIRIPFLNNEFKPAYFIHLVRNGYAVAEGIQRQAKIMAGNPFYNKGKYPIELCARQWKRSLEVVEENKQDLENFIEIKYEDLTADPQKTITNILNFLELEPLPSNYFSNSFEVHGKVSKIKNMNELSLERLQPEDIKLINNTIKPDLIKYNYSIIDK